MERRKFLIGAGSLAAGSAAAVGTGAFTSVQADRTLSIEVAGDQSAFLKFSKATNDSEQDDDGDGNVTENAEQYVDFAEGGEVSFDFTNADLGENGKGSGVNANATTKFDDLIDITNQGTQEVLVGVTSHPDGIGVYSEGEDADSDADTQDDATAMNFDGPTESEQMLAPGESLLNFGIYVTDTSALDGGGTITFRAEATNNND